MNGETVNKKLLFRIRFLFLYVTISPVTKSYLNEEVRSDRGGKLSCDSKIALAFKKELIKLPSPCKNDFRT